jgi:predicted helicase
MTALLELLEDYRQASESEREKGNYFEELIRCYFRYEATYADLYSDVWLYPDWAKTQGIDGRDTGIDLVAKTRGTEEYHAIQCKFYDAGHRMQKGDLDSFFEALGHKTFKHGIIVSTTNTWGVHATAALLDRETPVTRIDLLDLEHSQIDWSLYKPEKAPTLKAKKTLRPHQVDALEGVTAGLQEADRGKLIMACGTGKTFASLKMAEEIAGKGKRVLFLVPSLSLLSQTLTEWTQESGTPLHSFAVCSDSDVGKKRKANEDIVETFAHELRYPATTNAGSLALEMDKRHDAQHMSVVFSTYHSIDVISKAQKNHGLGDFALIVCDEAHRTTGATFVDESESNFVKVHNADFIRADKRIYMTATPRIYADSAKATALQDEVVLCSMDDEELYGKELHVINFSEAVARNLLVDYKVIVLTVDEAHISARLQNLLKDENNQINVDDAAKIVGCWKALSKQDQEGALVDDTDPMRRAVAFCQVIEANLGARTHKVSSKNIASMFQAVVEAYQEQEADHNTLLCEAEHVDGSMNASQKEAKLDWLKAKTPEDTCRILSNVRCLSEGVDVPALDAVLFLTPRNSQVDVVQSVGRVMRTAPGKKRGYVILPVVIPEGMDPSEALNDNKVYKVVWEVLQALRSHDDRFDAMINKLDLIGKDNSKMEIIAITDKLGKKAGGKKDQKETGKDQHTIGATEQQIGRAEKQTQIQFQVGEIERALYAKVVKKCGNRNHWEEWAGDIARIAKTHITRIGAIVGNPENVEEVKAFTEFSEELRDDLNGEISDEEVIEMLAQHLITKPVFDALFKDYSFAAHNPVSQAMQGVLDVLQEHHIEKEAETLERFYASVQMRAEGIDKAEGKQKIIVELYDKFFRNAFPKMTERLGIVYTPVEVVDFIIHSINDLLQQEFGQCLGSKGVHIIDPFTGTGTFITRLLQSGLISKEQLPHKYKHEIHANEIVLLAYYIAAINIEAVYHSLVGGDFEPFEGICLTDTFQLYEKDDLISELLVDNSARRVRQKELDIRVIMGNPPYSAGQGSANDNNQNVAYENLDSRIRHTYAAHSTATNKNALYDSYIRAIRWASDRLCKNRFNPAVSFTQSPCRSNCQCNGVLGFVTNAGFLEANTADGLRKCLAEEFSSIYVFHLRGNQRTSGERSRQEGGKIFGSGSRAPIAITLLVKNPAAKHHGQIHWHDIGDYLKQQEKLDIIQNFKSVQGITAANAWQSIAPDTHNDWINQRDTSFDAFIRIGDKRGKGSARLFCDFSMGIKTNRDAWVYNFSQESVLNNMEGMISFYNSEVGRYKLFCRELTDAEPPKVQDFLKLDAKKISWSRALRSDVNKLRTRKLTSSDMTIGAYRPFTKQHLYFDRYFINDVAKIPKIFPEVGIENLVICITGRGSTKEFCAFLSDALPDLEMVSKGQCFPLYLYEGVEDTKQGANADAQGDLFDGQSSPESGYTRKDGISDDGLGHFQAAYPKESIGKEDLFYYIYGLLHSPEYRTRYADNLSKELPRIPCVKRAKDFWAFSQAGRAMAELHINYESVDRYPVTLDCGEKNATKLKAEDFYVTKMKFIKKGEKSTVVYNAHITLRDIPLEAYEYIVNGKPALEWVMERQAVTTDKKSGITNDANLWATETMGDAKYPLELFQRVITVSLETMKIVKALPKLDID